MTVADATIPESLAAEHLELLRALARELERAMSAIVADDIAEFEDSIAQQQALSLRLTRLVEQQNHSAGLDPEGIDAGLKQQMRAAAVALDSLNRRYAALLQHAGRSVAMMVSLFRSFQGEFREGAGAGAHHATWSCQV